MIVLALESDRLEYGGEFNSKVQSTQISPLYISVLDAYERYYFAADY